MDIEEGFKFDMKYINFIKYFPINSNIYRRIFNPSLVKINDDIDLYCMRENIRIKHNNEFIP
jgi:hypothetical protein